MYDVAVIGAGVFGSWTAWHLVRARKSVLLIDAWGPGHSRSSSGGESRIIRMGYGADELYTRMAMRSLPMWKELFERTGQRLFRRTGVLWLGREGHPYSEATRRTLADAGVRTEILADAEIRRRYPQVESPGPNTFGIFEPESGALLARRSVAAVVEDAIGSGLVYSMGAVETPFNGDVHIRAGVFVFACGSWLPKVFPEVLGERICPTRQEVFFFAPPPGDIRFTPPQLPVWIDFTDERGPYGFPDIESRGFKLAFDQHGAAFDPDSGDRRISDEGVANARRFLAERFPALRDAALTESRVCQYENTSNGDFLIDRHPSHENVWIVGGGSGHGFKHGPAVGEYASAQILGGGEAEPRFSLASKQARQQRTVY
jgi:monomeric sarcosine oxidase